ncbi:alpha-hydroxy-acid oxidizing protein [Treponema sp.]|uniref:alpha-hydroxy-acid oxidizing protein n=1 Tax=Treponema sp. TaxID=166 RepID=UPI00298D7162|nr:alpha-hydroxy-acid oxidizing protein [Treponema sp.]MCQ2240173.1 alpha-hydroxy-acid oxidizing protein [Treponema sp.]
MSEYKCHFCPVCLGGGCIAQLPGMGGEDGNKNFILNCDGWKKIPSGSFACSKAILRLAPMTGAEQNMGYDDEKQYYFDMMKACAESETAISIGDGTPDCKLLWGIEAVKSVGKKAAVFIKPYENKKVFERMEWAEEISEYSGIDIDAFNIATMRNAAHLEKKTAENLREVQRFLAAKNIPFVIKGIFTDEDLELVRELKPDVAFVSNHGGRVPTRTGSVAEFLAAHADEIRNSCGEIWVDGGIRTKADFEKAQSYGVTNILLGRPYVTALCKKESFENILK